jgi:spermidine/putrescine transport system permease protein
VNAGTTLAPPAPAGAPSAVARLRSWLANPWGRPRFLALWTWLYMAWSIAPVLVAIRIGFNQGRSRSTFQGWSLRWYLHDPELSVLHDESLRQALLQSLQVSTLTMLVATPIGVALALGLARWRGRGSGAANLLMLFPLVTPEIVMGVSLFLVFDQLFGRFVPITFGTTTQVLGLVTFSISYVVIVVRGRLFAIGKDYEEAAMDLGASPAEALRRVLLPLLAPAIFAAFMIVFAIAIDDFVISAFLCVQGCETVPIKIYSTARLAPSPSLNALATLMLVTSLAAIGLAVAVQRRFIAKREAGARSAIEDFARLEI